MKNKLLIIKIFVLAVAAFGLPEASSARQADPSRFPDYLPLRPPAENVKPNYEGSVNYSGGVGTGENAEPGRENVLPAGEEQGSFEAVSNSVYGREGAEKEGKSLWLFAMTLAGGLILGYAYWRRRNRNRKIS